MDEKQTSSSNWNLEQSYKELPKSFYSESLPQSVEDPRIVVYNNALAKTLGVDDLVKNETELVQVLAGNMIPKGSSPIAQAYAGHQFGHFTKLGDGRALLLGEIVSSEGTRFDIQLKGAGRTTFSRQGDGRGTLHAMLREYLMSESMHALNIPSSRSLAVVSTGESVRREMHFPGGVLTRISDSHLRVGTFEYARQFLGKEGVQSILDYAIDRHFPKLRSTENLALSFLRKVQELQIDLIVNWMRVGFIHGVMNTDNMSIPGITIDYGPCAFINSYDPNTAFSSIDTQGRYRFNNQPKIAQWNISALAGSLLPLLNDNEKIAIDMAEQVLNDFPVQYEKKWLEMMGHKIGLSKIKEADASLINDLLDWMKATASDYTNTFIDIQQNDFSDSRYGQAPFLNWKSKWLQRLDQQEISKDAAKSLMYENNPLVIPRNHIVEDVLDKAANEGDYQPFNEFLEVLKSPYKNSESISSYQSPPDDGDLGYQTYCGT